MIEARTFLDGRVTLYPGDCRIVLPQLAENSIDSVVVDPPYHLQSIVKRFGSKNAAPAKHGMDGAFKRASAGFMGRTWDGGDIAFQVELWAEVLRVLKPGGYIMAFSGCRTYHRMACAIEDAGFITHPFFAWAFGSGLTKAHNLSKQLDKAANVAAREWDGWFYGTQSLKPAIEPIYFGQKPFERGLNGAQNCQKWGTGAINVGACRVGATVETWPVSRSYRPGQKQPGHNGDTQPTSDPPPGRWPANLIHDGSDEVLGCFPETHSAGSRCEAKWHRSNGNIFGKYNEEFITGARIGDNTGSAARFFASFPQEDVQRIFYTSKAGADDRLGSRHPTVKPLDLIQYLARLITPKNGVCLDLFAGTGITAEACFREGFRSILIEREAEYIKDIERRMSLVMDGPDTRAAAGIKACNRPRDDGPLFGGSDSAPRHARPTGCIRNGDEGPFGKDRNIDLLDVKIELAKIAVAAGCDIDVRLTKPSDEANER